MDYFRFAFSLPIFGMLLCACDGNVPTGPLNTLKFGSIYYTQTIVSSKIAVSMVGRIFEVPTQNHLGLFKVPADSSGVEKDESRFWGSPTLATNTLYIAFVDDSGKPMLSHAVATLSTARLGASSLQQVRTHTPPLLLEVPRALVGTTVDQVEYHPEQFDRSTTYLDLDGAFLSNSAAPGFFTSLIADIYLRDGREINPAIPCSSAQCPDEYAQLKSNFGTVYRDALQNKGTSILQEALQIELIGNNGKSLKGSPHTVSLKCSDNPRVSLQQCGGHSYDGTFYTNECVMKPRYDALNCQAVATFRFSDLAQ